jgi:hypothetical protein
MRLLGDAPIPLGSFDFAPSDPEDGDGDDSARTAGRKWTMARDQSPLSSRANDRNIADKADSDTDDEEAMTLSSPEPPPKKQRVQEDRVNSSGNLGTPQSGYATTQTTTAPPLCIFGD